MDTLASCPLCQSTGLKPFLECTDYTVSKEKFTIVQCASCGFRFTNPRPAEQEGGRYYLSDNYVSHNDSKKGFINILYHYARKFTLKKKFTLVSNLCRKETNQHSFSLLDLGCGTGAFLNVCKKHGWKAEGIEPSANARAVAKKNYGLNLYDISSWDKFTGAAFDVITAWHVFEHIYDLEGELEQVKRVMAPKGILVMALPNCNSADAQFYGKYWAAYDVPRHLWHFTPADVKRFFEKQGFILESVLPMPWDSYYICMLSEKYKSFHSGENSSAGNINYIRALIHGWYSNKSAQKTGAAWSSQIYILKKII